MGRLILAILYFSFMNINVSFAGEPQLVTSCKLSKLKPGDFVLLAYDTKSGILYAAPGSGASFG